MGLGAAAAVAMSLSMPAATVLLRPRCPPFSSTSLSSTVAVAVGRCLGKSSSVVVRDRYHAFRRSSEAAGGLKLPATFSSSAASPAERRSNAAALRLRRGCPNCGLQTGRSFRAFATMASELPESAANNPGLHETPDEATKGYFLQQTMYRIKDPKVSLDFYTRILGMSLLKRLDFPENKFSLFFVGFEDAKSAPTDPGERMAWTFGKTGTLELTHNWGTESDENFKGHHNGNSDPRGYGHIGVTVDDTYKACERFEKLGVKFVKKPDDGKMKGLAFIQDPDGYWIEIFDVKNMSSITAKA